LKNYIEIIRDWFLNLTDAQKRLFVIAGTVGVSLILTIAVLATMESGREKNPNELERINIVSPISAEEMFIPDEPDFIPGVLLEREKRLSWTEKDAMEYWQDPLENGEAVWRAKLENEIDKLLEYVP